MKILGIVLLVVGVGLTAAGLFGQLVLTEDDGHHDGRAPTFALDSVAGADELIVEPSIDPTARIERAGQVLADYDEIHGARFHTFTVADDLSSYVHTTTEEVPADGRVGIGAVGDGEHRVVAQASPAGGPDLLELGVDVRLDGEPLAAQEIATADTWTGSGLTVTRQGLDFVLSEAWTGDDHMGGPAFLAMFRADDLAFVHAHGDVIDGNRFSFAADLPGRGEYLAAVEFLQHGELVTALFRFEL